MFFPREKTNDIVWKIVELVSRNRGRDEQYCTIETYYHGILLFGWWINSRLPQKSRSKERLLHVLWTRVREVLKLQAVHTEDPQGKWNALSGQNFRDLQKSWTFYSQWVQKVRKKVNLEKECRNMCIKASEAWHKMMMELSRTANDIRLFSWSLCFARTS